MTDAELLAAFNAWTELDGNRWTERADVRDIPDRALLEWLVCLKIAETGARVIVCVKAGGCEDG